MTARAEMIGLTFGRLTVTKGFHATLSSGRKLLRYSCLCVCGRRKEAFGEHLRSGKIASCGCYKSEATTARFTKHGHNRAAWRSPEYRSWAAMINRCENPKCEDWKYYGARGIGVCREWRDSFPAFFAHVGSKPSSELSIDRIDTNGNYEPGNYCSVGNAGRAKAQSQRSRAEVRAQQQGVA